MTPRQIPLHFVAVFLSVIVFSLLVGGCKNNASSQNQTAFEYHEGDIVFQSLPRNNALVRAIEGVTDSDLSHCGVVMREKGDWVVYEALGTVHCTPLSTWVRRGRNNGHFEVYRLVAEVALDVEKLRSGLRPFMGKLYDMHYAPDDSEIYCSELVFKAYDRSQGIKIGEWEPLGSLNWKPFEPFILSIESTVPFDRLMITPVALTRSGLVERVYAGEAD